MGREQQRAELHKTIWRIANDLRGSVDGWDFKAYVLGFLFYRFISENIADYFNAEERAAGKTDFNYAKLDDTTASYGRQQAVDEKGFFIAPSQLFCNIAKTADTDPNLNETLEKVFASVQNSAVGARSEEDFRGLFNDVDVNSDRLGYTVAARNKKLAAIIAAIADLNFGNYGETKIDAFGDAYEYLMQMFASTAGKSGGEFFTPQEVGELLAKIVLANNKSGEIRKVYDPACGSGGLLLRFAKILGADHVGGFYGQEINLTTYNLARINMFLHNINYNKFDIELGDTLLKPKHWDDEPFDAIVSNPPYSIKWEGKDNPILINDQRFSPAGVLAPKSYADLAFTMHMLSWLSTDGTAAIVEFPGVLYRGGAEAKIRKYLVDNNFVDAVIQLPPNLFYGTSIATCILVLRKSKSDDKTLFIDASDQFIKPGKDNSLSTANIAEIVRRYTDRQDEQYLTKLASISDIADNDYSLSVNTYVEQRDTREKIDINEVNKKLTEVVAREAELRTAIDQIVAEITA